MQEDEWTGKKRTVKSVVEGLREHLPHDAEKQVQEQAVTWEYTWLTRKINEELPLLKCPGLLRSCNCSGKMRLSKVHSGCKTRPWSHVPNEKVP